MPAPGVARECGQVGSTAGWRFPEVRLNERKKSKKVPEYSSRAEREEERTPDRRALLPKHRRKNHASEPPARRHREIARAVPWRLRPTSELSWRTLLLE